MSYSRRDLFPTIIAAAALPLLGPITPAAAVEGNPGVERKVDTALKTLYKDSPTAKELGGRAKGVLIFPHVVKAGFLFGGTYGEGELQKSGVPAGYYRSVSASYGLQAGVQWFGYALFFMNDQALSYLDRSEGWEIGIGPSVVFSDVGFAKKYTSTTLTQDIYAFVFGQRGIMGGAGLEGSKISKM